MTHRNHTRTQLRHISKLIDTATDKRAKAQLQRTYQLLINELLKYNYDNPTKDNCHTQGDMATTTRNI